MASYTTSVTPSLNGFTGACWACAALTSPAISILLNCTIHIGRPAKHLASKYSDRSFDAHSPRQPSVSPASLAFSAPESYFTMHASYLIIICPRFTLGVAAVTEKNGGQMDGRTHARTHTHTRTHTTAITLTVHARRRGLIIGQNNPHRPTWELDKVYYILVRKRSSSCDFEDCTHH